MSKYHGTADCMLITNIILSQVFISIITTIYHTSIFLNQWGLLAFVLSFLQQFI